MQNQQHSIQRQFESEPNQLFPFSDNKRQDSYSSFENKSQSAYDTHNNGGSSSGSNRRGFDNNIGTETVVRKHVSDNQMSSILDRRHLEDVTNHQQQQQQQQNASNSWQPRENQALIIDDELNKLDPVRVYVSIHFWHICTVYIFE